MILLEVPGTAPETILLYGHCDKQPEMVGWADGLGPWQAVRRGDRLYGRGAQDDGYAVFCALTAIEAVQRSGAPHARCVVLIEACEESGSGDLPAYMEALAARIGEPDLVICLDSGCGNYDQLWGTTSLRGIVNGVLTVEVLTEGMHSGAASGIVPSSFRIARQLLSRIEDDRTGAVVKDFHVELPPARLAEARAVVDVLAAGEGDRFPVMPGMRYAKEDPVDLLLAGTWEPALSIIGADGMPVDRRRRQRAAAEDLAQALAADPADARRGAGHTPPARAPRGGPAVRRPRDVQGGDAVAGLGCPGHQPWLLEALHAASQRHFGKPAMFKGLGGSIPFMAMLGERFPRAQFFITGTGGPGSNAHGPNEFLHLPMAKRLTACVADVIVDHYRARG